MEVLEANPMNDNDVNSTYSREIRGVARQIVTRVSLKSTDLCRVSHDE